MREMSQDLRVTWQGSDLDTVTWAHQVGDSDKFYLQSQRRQGNESCLGSIQSGTAEDRSRDWRQCDL